VPHLEPTIHKPSAEEIRQKKAEELRLFEEKAAVAKAAIKRIKEQTEAAEAQKRKEEAEAQKPRQSARITAMKVNFNF
jgi:hypothetical protein